MLKLKICFIDFDHYPPKVRIEARRLPEELAKFDFETTIICLKGNEEKDTEEINGVKVIRIKLENALSCREFVRKTLPHIEREGYDIIHLFFHPAMIYFKFWAPGQFFVMDIRTNPLRSGFKLWLARKRLYFSSLFFRYVVVNGEGVGREILGNRKFLDVSLGVDLDPESGVKEYRQRLRRELGLGQDDLILVYSGSIELIRKLEYLLSIAKEIKEQRIKNIKLLIIGGGDAEKFYRTETKKKKLTEIVYFLGHQPHALLQKYLLASDIGLALVPKLECFDNQMPLKTLEYLASSLAIVATKTKANQSIIKNGINGLLTEDCSDEIVKKTLKLVNDQKLLTKLKHNALPTVKDLTWEKLARNILAPFYLKINENHERE